MALIKRKWKKRSKKKWRMKKGHAVLSQLKISFDCSNALCTWIFIVYATRHSIFASLFFFLDPLIWFSFFCVSKTRIIAHKTLFVSWFSFQSYFIHSIFIHIFLSDLQFFIWSIFSIFFLAEKWKSFLPSPDDKSRNTYDHCWIVLSIYLSQNKTKYETVNGTRNLFDAKT